MFHSFSNKGVVNKKRKQEDFFKGKHGAKCLSIEKPVKKNLNRFPDDFMFQLTKSELDNLKSQIVISS